MIAFLFQWFITYLLHSSVLLGCAALLDWRRRLTSRGMSTALWRIALFGGFITATLQPALQGVPTDFQHSPSTASAGLVAADDFSTLMLPPLQADAIDVAPLLIPLWLGMTFVGITGLLLRLVRVTRQVDRMQDVTSPPLARCARQLAIHARIATPRLRSGMNLQAPLVAPGRVICIPVWMLEQYERPRLTAALAHEVAHLRRHDNEWRILSRLAAIIGWLQPFNRLALKRMDESAELACDAWAATATGLRHELACTLEDCAIRAASTRHVSAVTIGMAANRHQLLERVISLLEDGPVNTQSLRRAARWSSAALLSIAVAGCFVVVSTLDDDVPPRWLADSGLYQSLLNSTQDVRSARSVIVNSPENYVFIRVTEDFSFVDHDPAQGQSGTAVISQTRGGVTRSVRYERDTSGQLRRSYKINGRARELDTEAERWLEAMMPLAGPSPAIQ